MDENFSARTFGPNWVWVSALTVIAAGAYLIGRDMDPSRAAIPLWALLTAKAAILAIPVILLLWLLSVRLTIDRLGLRYRSLFREKEMRWDEVDELYSGAVRTLLYGFIPVGTRYSFRLRAGLNAEQQVENVRHIGTVKFTFTKVKSGTAARVVSFGNRFSDAETIGSLMNELALPHVWRKVSQRYEDGLEVDFGDFVLCKQGVKIHLLGMFPELTRTPIPWENVSSYSVANGSFTLFYRLPARHTEVSSASRPVAQIPNFQTMISLLHHLKPIEGAR